MTSSPKTSKTSWELPILMSTRKNDTRPVLNFTYMLSNKVGVELMLSTAFKHDVRLRSDDIPELGNNVDILEFKQRPLALGVAFYPRGDQAPRIHPYLGAGTLYTKASLKLPGAPAYATPPETPVTPLTGVLLSRK